jgi:hypothetical protein
LKGFLKHRIENGKNLSKVIRGNLAYYESVGESSLSIDRKRERLYECFRNHRNIYPAAVFPDVYFVIGARNSGGTVFPGGLIIGAEMFGNATSEFKPPLDIEYVDEVVSHELIHFQQKYAANNTLLAQCIREGSADFLGELIAGDHSNKTVYAYGEAHIRAVGGVSQGEGRHRLDELAVLFEGQRQAEGPRLLDRLQDNERVLQPGHRQDPGTY